MVLRTRTTLVVARNRATNGEWLARSSASTGTVGWAATTTGGGASGWMGSAETIRSSTGDEEVRRRRRRGRCSTPPTTRRPAVGTRLKPRRASRPRRAPGTRRPQLGSSRGGHRRPRRAASPSVGAGRPGSRSSVPTWRVTAHAELRRLGASAGRGCSRRSSISPWSSRAKRSVTRRIPGDSAPAATQGRLGGVDQVVVDCRVGEQRAQAPSSSSPATSWARPWSVRSWSIPSATSSWRR